MLEDSLNESPKIFTAHEKRQFSKEIALWILDVEKLVLNFIAGLKSIGWISLMYEDVEHLKVYSKAGTKLNFWLQFVSRSS